MFDHDEFCHAKPTIDPRRCAECKQLAAVRADERERQEEGWSARLNSTVAWAENGVRADLRAKVEALRAENSGAADTGNRLDRDFNLGKVYAYERILALIDGSSE